MLNATAPTPVLISVCITTYNHEKFLAQALDSVLMQQGDFVLEVLVGEDGSSDNTAHIVRDYAVRYPDTVRAFFTIRMTSCLSMAGKRGAKTFCIICSRRAASTSPCWMAMIIGQTHKNCTSSCLSCNKIRA